MAAELKLNGPFYQRFTSDKARFRSEDHTCIRQTVERLLSTVTTEERPGMLLGKIQSGKTKTFLGAVALAFDNGTDIAIVLTKGTRALSKQTVTRVKKDFRTFLDQDELQVFDIMEVPSLTVALIRSRGHLPKGGYDVPHVLTPSRPTRPATVL